MRVVVAVLLALTAACAVLPKADAEGPRVTHKAVIGTSFADTDLLCVERTPAMAFADPNIVGVICIETVGQLRARVNRTRQAN